MIAITPKGKRNYILRDDLELSEDQQTEWRIQDLTERDRVRIHDSVKWSIDQVTGSVSSGNGTRVYLTCLAGLLGATEKRPLKDVDGNVVEDPDEMCDEYLARIPWPAKEELTLAIQEGLTMTEAEVEKPEPSQSDS